MVSDKTSKHSPKSNVCFERDNSFSSIFTDSSLDRSSKRKTTVSPNVMEAVEVVFLIETEVKNGK